jgi:hypothetical protein
MVERIERWFLDPVPIVALVLARIVYGAVLVCAYLAILPDVGALYGPRGLPGPAPIQSFDPTVFIPARDVVNAAFPSLPPSVFWMLFALLIASAAAFSVGYKTRVAGTVALVLHVVLARCRNPLAQWGWAAFIQPLMLYVIAAPTGRYLSVDAYLRRSDGAAPEPVPERWMGPAWPLRLLQVHTCLMYTSSAWPRIDDVGWLKGHAVYVAVTNVLFSRAAIDWHPFQVPLAAINYATLVLECVAPITLWVSGIGPWFAYALITLHVGLEVLTQVGWWNFVMIASLLSFIPPRQLATALRLVGVGPPANDAPAQRGRGASRSVTTPETGRR